MNARFFVTGTDTGVGKTQVAAALLQLLVERGQQPFAFKPYESGLARLDRPADGLRLQRAAGGWQDLDTVSLHRFREPLAPGIAARLARRHPSWRGAAPPSRVPSTGSGRTESRSGRAKSSPDCVEPRPPWRRTLDVFRSFGGGPVVVEGAGGLFVPLDDTHDVHDLARALRLPVVLVARAGLGTVNHTCLSLRALAQFRLKVAVVLVQERAGRDAATKHNRLELERRFPGLEVLGPVPHVKASAAREAAFRRALEPLVGPA